ncbi:TonB-dependent receptor [Saprospiraceae bacterium]|nr:TonB-dependent receptor [Saprospiraceae bacterium]
MKSKIIYFILLSGVFISTLQAQLQIDGTILDSYNEPLIGVAILENGTENGTVTDLDGKFKFQVSNTDAVLKISYLGYAPQEITIGNQTSFLIEMLTDVEQLEEIVVVGYGTQKKKVVTGAISKVTAASLEDMPVVRIESSLQGRTSGVRVTTGSGQPGDGGQVRVRGTTTIGNSDPLYVVDGVPIGGGIDFLNQGDIESIEVLKDAASAAIYGARAANGVILVTTKKGETGTLVVNYNMYYGTQAPWKKLALLNATEYGILMNESSAAAGGDILFEDPQSLGEGTDWQDAVFRNNAPMQNHEISLSSGSDRSQYYMSFGYFDQEGIVSDVQSRFQRFTTRFNSAHKITDKLTFGSNVAYTNIKGVGVATNTEFGSPLGRAVNLDPITPLLETRPEVLESSVFQNFPVVTNDNGIPYGISDFVTSEIVNPVAALETQQGFGYSHKVVGNAFAELEIIDGLKFRSSIGTDLAFWGGEGFTPLFYLNPATQNPITQYNRSQNRGLYWIFENTLSYSKLIGNHDFSILAGSVGERNKGEGISGNVSNIPAGNLEEASLGFDTTPDNETYGGFEYLATSASYLSRINYNYKQKYLLSALMRVDGSSNFGSNNKFGYFPSVSLGWVISEENFLSGNSFINFAKIRGSWGINGNDRIGAFRYVSTVGGGRNYVFGLGDELTQGTSPNAIANPDLRWEQTTQLNLGFDAKIFRKISVTFDIYEKNTKDMLLDIAVPGYVGNAGPVGNVATLENRGVELELGYRNKVREVSFDISGNASYNENEITFIGNEREFLGGQTFSPQGLEFTRTQVGMPIGFLFGYTTDGIFQNQADVDAYVNADGTLIQPDASPGDFKFVDLNNDGILDDNDRGMIGDPTPDWTYGVNLSLAYKGFDIVMFGQGVQGNDVYKATRRFDLQMANMTADALGRWTGEGTSDTYPRLVMNDPNKNFSRSSDFYVEDGSFFRIKNLQLGYNLPIGILEKVNMSKLRVYVSGNNLLTFTKYSGFDPEIVNGVDRGIYPQARYFLIGANAGF